MIGPLTPEAALLLLIARPSIDEPHRARLRAAIQSGDLDWDLLHRMVSRHRLGPFLYAHLDAIAAEGVPRPVFMDLWRTHERNTRRNAALDCELARVVGVLEAAGVATVAYKGPILAAQLYGDTALREFEDLDVLVPAGKLARVKAVLLANDYDVADPLAPAAEAAMYRAGRQYHRVFVHRETGEKLEVHWKTDPLFPVERAGDADWWATLPRVTLHGHTVRVFAPSELLLILCLHGSKHQGHRLGWMVEIAQLIRMEVIDWAWVAATADRLRCRRRVQVSLLLAHDWAGAELPAGVLAATQASSAVREMAGATSSRWFSSDIAERAGLDRLRMDIRLCDRWVQRARTALAITFAPSTHEWSAYALPRPLEFLYVPIRLSRLVIRSTMRMSSATDERD